MNFLLVYTDRNEPVTRVMIKNKDKFRLQLVDLKELLKKGIVFDKITQKETQIYWKIPGRNEVINSDDIFLINRAFYIPNEWFSDFYKEDRDYAQLEFWAYVTFALNSFPNSSDRPGLGSLSGNCYALPFQWKLISSNIKKLITPEFFFGNIKDLNISKNNLIYSSVYNFYFWKLNQPKKEELDNIFAIKKPKGIPVLSLVIGSSVSVHNLDNTPLNIDKNIIQLIMDKSLEIKKLFDVSMCEVLFFINKTQVTFGMFHNRPIAAQMTKSFEEEVLSYFEQINT